MMRALLDTDVVLDLLLDRPPFADTAEALWEAHRQGRFVAFVSPITPVNVFYLTRKLKGAAAARQAVAALVATVAVCSVDQAVLAAALALPFADFEDAVQHASAQAAGLDAIVTRNLADYVGATLPVYSTADFLDRLLANIDPRPTS